MKIDCLYNQIIYLNIGEHKMIKKYKNKWWVKSQKDKKIYEKVDKNIIVEIKKEVEVEDLKWKSKFLFESNLEIDWKRFKKWIHIIEDWYLEKKWVCYSWRCPLIRKL